MSRLEEVNKRMNAGAATLGEEHKGILKVPHAPEETASRRKCGDCPGNHRNREQDRLADA